MKKGLHDAEGYAQMIATTTTMESIMTEADPELLKRFEAEEKKSKNSHEVLLQYLLEFNQRALAKK